MELKTFITESLCNIIDGVVDAQEHAAKKGAYVNPPPYGKPEQSYFVDTPRGRMIASLISFEIGVTMTEADNAKSGIGIFVAAFGVGVEGGVNSENVAVNRLKFEVPVAFPVQEHSR